MGYLSSIPVQFEALSSVGLGIHVRKFKRESVLGNRWRDHEKLTCLRQYPTAIPVRVFGL